MDLWQLYIFVSVVDHKSFSKASQAINLSQPTVSSHIKDLEDYFQCRLLDRLGKVTEPTGAGRILYRYAVKLLTLRDNAESALHDFLGRDRGKLIIGGSTIPSGYILPELMGPFSRKFPDVSIELTAGDTHQIVQMIKQGKLEAGIVGAPVEDPMIRQERLIEDEMMVVVPKNHKWADLSHVNCSELFDQRFIGREKGSGTWQSILLSLKNAGFNQDDLKPCITMGNTVSVIQAILNNVGISILSTMAVRDCIDSGRLKALPVKDLNLKRFFYLTVPARRTISPICRKFIEFIKTASR